MVTVVLNVTVFINIREQIIHDVMGTMPTPIATILGSLALMGRLIYMNQFKNINVVPTNVQVRPQNERVPLLNRSSLQC